MDRREAYLKEIDAACDELKRAGLVHARDLTRHILKAKQRLMLYDKARVCCRSNGGEVSAKR